MFVGLALVATFCLRLACIVSLRPPDQPLYLTKLRQPFFQLVVLCANRAWLERARDQALVDKANSGDAVGTRHGRCVVATAQLEDCDEVTRRVSCGAPSRRLIEVWLG